MASTVLPNGIIIPEKYSRDWYADLYHNWQELDNLLGGGTPKDGTLTIQKNGTTIGTFSANQATDETIDITVPDVNDATLTIQKNGTDVATFSANASTNATANITVPTKTSDLTNDSDFVQSSDLATVATSGSYNDLTDTPTIPTVNNATLTIQKNGTNVQTFTANQSTNATANITVPTKTSDLTNDSGFITSDNTKIPLAGSNAISGDLIPSTNGAVNLGGSSYQWNNAYIKSLTINGVAAGDILTHNASEFVPRSGGAVFTGQEFSRNANDSSLIFRGGINAWENGAQLELCGKDNAGTWELASINGSDYSAFSMRPNGTIYATHGAGLNVAYATQYNWVAVDFFGGDSRDNGSSLRLHGKDFAIDNYLYAGAFTLQARRTLDYQLIGFANGTLTWNGTAIQYTSDKRLKQQITQIDNALLDAWEDVELSQFKYNDAVEQKGDNARLHTGYVVQQIQKACESHGVDISAYGLFCHEEYPEETEEVEVENEDGTKTKERKVIREASEHYSLRYTEALIVECKYLRKCIKELRNEIEELKSSK